MLDPNVEELLSEYVDAHAERIEKCGGCCNDGDFGECSHCIKEQSLLYKLRELVKDSKK